MKFSNTYILSAGRTPLHMCCLGGFVECCRKFLQVGVDLDAQDTTGKAPLHLAAFKGWVFGPMCTLRIPYDQLEEGLSSECEFIGRVLHCWVVTLCGPAGSSFNISAVTHTLKIWQQAL